MLFFYWLIDFFLVSWLVYHYCDGGFRAGMVYDVVIFLSLTVIVACCSLVDAFATLNDSAFRAAGVVRRVMILLADWFIPR